MPHDEMTEVHGIATLRGEAGMDNLAYEAMTELAGILTGRIDNPHLAQEDASAREIDAYPDRAITRWPFVEAEDLAYLFAQDAPPLFSAIESVAPRLCQITTPIRYRALLPSSEFCDQANP